MGEPDRTDMAKRKTSTKSSAVKAQISALRRKGLTRARSKGRPGGSAYALVRKLKPVLEKRAQAVKVDKATAKKYKDVFPIVKGKAIIPVFKGEKISVSKKTGEIRRTTFYGKKSQPNWRKIKSKVFTRQELMNDVLGDKIKGTENTVYRINTTNGYSITRVGVNDMMEFLQHYSVEEFIASIEVVIMQDAEWLHRRIT